MKKPILIRSILLGIVLIATGFSIWLYTKPASISSQKKSSSQIYPVKVIHPEIKSMPLALQEVGTVEPEKTVNIISQVNGVLKKIDIAEGQQITQGQLLFEIDSSTYTAQVTQVKANLQHDLAQLKLLKATADRYGALAKLEYVTRQQYEEAIAAVKEQEAIVSSSQAQLQQQEIQLSYTQIRSPISGKAGAIMVHPGDLIVANSATPLVVINRLDPVLISFNLSQNRLQNLLSYQRAGTLTVEIMAENDVNVLATGDLVFISNTVSNQTGTVQIKAKAANPNLILWPGQLVTVRLILTIQPNAIVIPDSSIQLGQNGSYVYLVKNNTAVIQLVTIDRNIGHESIVSQGLQGNETVIQEIPPGLQPGSTVQLENSSSSAGSQR